MRVTDRPSPDAPSLTQAIIVQMVYLDYKNPDLWTTQEDTVFIKDWTGTVVSDRW